MHVRTPPQSASGPFIYIRTQVDWHAVMGAGQVGTFTRVVTPGACMLQASQST